MKASQRESLLVLRAQVGDREALEALLRNIQGPLHNYLQNMLQDPALAEDTLQDVLLIVARKLSTLRTPELFRPWAYRVSSRAAFRSLRKERRWREQVRDQQYLENQPTDQDSTNSQEVDAARLRRSLDQVSPPLRAVLALHYVNELSLQDVAAALEIPVGTVKSRLSRGLQTLRRTLK